MARREDPDQLRIDWTEAAPRPTDAEPTLPSNPVSAGPPAAQDLPALMQPTPLVQRLPWDFRTTFPEPTPEAIEAGVVTEDDLDPANIRSLHENHARHGLFVLTELDAVLDARRRGVDPRNNKTPMLKEAKERLQQLFEAEPIRLQRWWRTLMETYEQAFGPEAADAFDKAIRAWHARIEVVAER